MFGKIIKRTIQTLAGLGLLVMFGFPLTATWLDAHPETTAALEMAAGQVDHEAGLFTRARQYVGGISKGRQAVAEKKREAVEDKAYDEARRKEERRRRFNSGELSDDSYNSEY